MKSYGAIIKMQKIICGRAEAMVMSESVSVRASIFSTSVKTLDLLINLAHPSF